MKKDKNAAIVSQTKEYYYADPYHYDSVGYLDLGIAFARAVYLLNNVSDD